MVGLTIWGMVLLGENSLPRRLRRRQPCGDNPASAAVLASSAASG